MKLPNKIDQKDFMCKKCYFDGEYCREYGLAKEKYSEFSTYKDSKVPVKWRISKHAVSEGWIVGFGFVFNGSIIKQDGDKYFKKSKRVNYVRVRTTPTSKELKIPLKNIRLQNVQ